MLKKLLVLIGFTIFLISDAQAQYTQVGDGLGLNGNNSYGPMRSLNISPAYNRHAYIYPALTITTLNHGDTIRSIEFRRGPGDTMTGSTNFKIYIGNVYKADFGPGSINWLSEARDSGLTLVYNKSPKEEVGSLDQFVRFDFIEPYVFDTTGNAVNLEILVEYVQTLNQQNDINWYVESSTSIFAFNSNNETKYINGGSTNWLDSITNSSSILRPTLKINHPKYNTQLETKQIYSLGTVPILMGTPDTIKAVVKNIGVKTVYNHKVYLTVTGANSYIDSLIIDSIHPYEEQMVMFGNYMPSNSGTEYLEIKLGEDDDITDNVNIKERVVNYNVYSHCDPNGTFYPGGIGFSGTTGDFVAKFYVKNKSYINQVKVDFTGTGRLFQIGIWNDDGNNGEPGTQIFVSDTLTTVPGQNIINIPRVKVEKGYYVGITQASTNIVSFRFQFEVPIRKHVFYFSEPSGDSIWERFAPGYDYNFNIQPRLQTGNDILAELVLNPINGDSILYSPTDSIDLVAKFSNVGFLDQNNIPLKMELINRFNQIEFTETKIIALKSGEDTILNFGRISLYRLGNYVAKASVNLNLDSVKDNNTALSNFVIYKKNDVGVDIAFSPSKNDTFEVNDDYLWPLVRASNYGSYKQTNFPVKYQLLKDGEVIATDSQFITLDGNNSSQIVSFDSFTIGVGGNMVFQAFTDLDRDEFPINDTLKVNVYAKISRDIAMLNILNPKQASKKATSTSFQPYISFRNQGLKKQDSVYTYGNIYDVDGNHIWGDTSLRSLNLFSTGQTLFDNFMTSAVPGLYQFKAKTSIKDDQVPSNDTLTTWFEVVNGRDLKLIAMEFPMNMDRINIGSTSVKPRFKVYNNGLVNSTNPEFVLIINNDATEYYRDTIQYGSIKTGDTAIVVCNQLLDFFNGGEYTVSLYNIWMDEDGFSTNDTLYSAYSVAYQTDLAILEHVTPKDKSKWVRYSTLFPSINIANKGFDTIYDASVKLEIKGAAQVLWRDTVFLDLLKPGENSILTSNKIFQVTEIEHYQLTSELMVLDDFKPNDKLSTDFDEFVDYDVAVDSITFPKEDKVLKYRTIYKPLAYISNKGKYAINSDLQIDCRVYIVDTLIYDVSIFTTIDSGQSKSVAFDSLLRYSYPAQARIEVIARLQTDLVPENDSIGHAFRFTDNASVLGLANNNAIKVIPNPSKGAFYISSTYDIESIAVYDVAGKVVMKVDGLNSKKYVLDNLLSPGVYFLSLNGADNHSRIKIIKH